MRPALKIWAGRTDFSRTQFAKHFRETFQTEFDRMRRDLQADCANRGWLSLDLGISTVTGLMSSFVANLVLAIALYAGKSLLGQVALPGWLRGKGKVAKLETEIDGLRSRVDDALTQVRIAIHPELFAHARQFGGPIQRREMDNDAWPLPDYVRRHLGDGNNGSWW